MTGQNGLSAFLGTSESPVVIHDEHLKNRGQQERAQLRSIPLLYELGVEEFVYDDLWAREFQLVEHGYTDPHEVSPADVSFPLGHIVTAPQLLPRHEQEFDYEGISQADATWELLRTASERISDGQYVLVTDTDAPEIPSRTPVKGRSAADQFNAVTFDYLDLVRDYVVEHVDSALPLDYTKNVFFHRISEYHSKHGAPASTLPELFKYEEAPAESPVWDPLYYFLEHDLQDILDEYEEHVMEALRSWIERGDTAKIARRMIATLHRCDFDAERLAEYQNDTNR